jgi:hypothetical protein
VFESKASGLMFESNLFGTHPAFYLTSLKTHEVVHFKDVPLSIEQEDTIWDLIVQKYDGKPYNYLGALYLGWRMLLHRFFKTEVPTENAWAKSDSYYCDELYDVFNHIDGLPKINVVKGMKTPHDVWEHLK